MITDVLIPTAGAVSLLGHVWAVRTVRGLRVRLTEARRQAAVDPLTGLANRAGLAAALADLAGEPYDLVLVDLDGFKQINDAYGHHAGDALLVEVAARLSAPIDEIERAVAARIGGDEMVLVCPSPVPIARLLGAEVIQALAEPVVLPDGRELTVRASVGAVSVMAGDDTSRVLRAADIALYKAKAAGGDGVAEYDRAAGLPEVEQRPSVRLRDLAATAQVLRGVA